MRIQFIQVILSRSRSLNQDSLFFTLMSTHCIEYLNRTPISPDALKSYKHARYAFKIKYFALDTESGFVYSA